MADSDKEAHGRPEPAEATAPCGTPLTLLCSEIDFWQEMIRVRGDDMPVEALERMHFALAFARRRLAEHGGSAAGSKPGHEQPS